MKRTPALAYLIALLLVGLSCGLVFAQGTIADETVTLGVDGKNYRNISLTEGTNVTIDISVQSGDSIYFTIWYHDGDEYLYGRLYVTSVQTQWTAPSTDGYDFYVRSAGTSTVHVLIRAGETGGFDPLPIVVVVLVLAALFVSAFFVLRLRKRSTLAPPPPPPPPPP